MNASKNRKKTKKSHLNAYRLRRAVMDDVTQPHAYAWSARGEEEMMEMAAGCVSDTVKKAYKQPSK